MGLYIKKQEQPWIEDGRWYHFFIESDGSSYTLTVADIEGATISSQNLFLPVGYHIVDIKYDINSIESSSANITMMLKFGSSGEQGVVLPAKAQFDYMDLWLFAHKEG